MTYRESSGTGTAACAGDVASPGIAALPMYDWPEVRAETDAFWSACRDGLRGAGIAAPHALTRSNAGLPAVPGGIRDARGALIAPDPATLDADRLDVDTLWRHPAMRLAQTCWGPLHEGLLAHVHVIAQPDYSPFFGGAGSGYRSALVMRGDPRGDVAPPAGTGALLDPAQLHGLRFACNKADSMSGVLGLIEDLAAAGIAIGRGGSGFWSSSLDTGNHRASVVAVASGNADVAAIDCRSFDLCRRHEPAARQVRVVGWTALRAGLPLVAGGHIDGAVVADMRRALAAVPGLIVV